MGLIARPDSTSAPTTSGQQGAARVVYNQPQ